MTQQAPPPLLFGPATLDPAFHSVAGGQWVEEELNLSHFRDQRIRKRVYRLVQQLAEHIGEPIPNACQDWANTKAAYRLLSNPRLTRISHKPIVGSPVWSPAGVVRTGFAPFFWLAPCEGEASAVPRPSVALAGRSGPATDGFRPNSAHTAPLRRSAAPRLSALRRLSAA